MTTYQGSKLRTGHLPLNAYLQTNASNAQDRDPMVRTPRETVAHFIFEFPKKEAQSHRKQAGAQVQLSGTHMWSNLQNLRFHQALCRIHKGYRKIQVKSAGIKPHQPFLLILSTRLSTRAMVANPAGYERCLRQPVEIGKRPGMVIYFEWLQ